MRRWNGPRRYGGPWYADQGKRIRFEYGAKDNYPTLQRMTRTAGPKVGCVYRVIVTVPYYEPRRVEILFAKRAPSLPTIAVDGPTDSPHRFSENHLCIWHPDDPEVNRWLIADGLLHLLRLIETHLFREAWWRETGVWPGPEAGHTDDTDHSGDRIDVQ